MGCDRSKPAPTNENRLKMNNPVEKEKQKVFEKKVILIGDAGVGKSSIAQRFCRNKFDEEHNVTLGAAYLQQKIVLQNGASMKLHIWDTSGEERFRAMLSMYYKDASAAILTYAIDSVDTLSHLEFWMTQLKDCPPMVICVAGNKCDLEDKRVIPIREGRTFAKKHDLIFYETSCKNNTGIQELFMSLAQKIYDEDAKNKPDGK